MPLWLIQNWKLIAFAALIGGLSTYGFVEHQRGNSARSERALAEHDRDAWKANYDVAAGAADNNAKALADYKERAEESSILADQAQAEAKLAAKKYETLLAKTRAEHEAESKNPSSGFMRALLDGLCRDQTTAACPNY